MDFLRNHLKANVLKDQPNPPPKDSYSFEPLCRLSGESWVIILLGIILITGLWAFVLKQINNDYDRTLQEASRETMNVAIAFEEHIRKILIEADKDLVSIKQSYELGSLSSPIFTANAQNAADDSTRNLIAIYDEEGTVVASFIQYANGLKRSDRNYFLIHRDMDSQKMCIDEPITDRMSGSHTIPLTRRINKPDGSFGGIVFIGLKSQYILDFYQKMNLGEDQLISLSGLDGIVRARQSGANVTFGQNIIGSSLWNHIQSSPNGTYLTNDALDGISRVTSYRVMPDYPLTFTIGKTTKVTFVDYEQHKRQSIIGATLTSFFIVISCVLLVGRSENQRKLQKELERRVEDRTQELLMKDELNRQLAATSETAQKEKDLLSSLISSMSDEVWLADTDKNFALVNPAANREFARSYAGVSIEEFAATIEVLRLDGSPRPIEESPVLRALQGEVIRGEAHILRASDGELRYREVNASPVMDVEGNVIGSVTVSRDVTERKRMEEELVRAREDHYKRYLDSLPDNAVIYNTKRDKQGRIVDFIFDYFNPSASKNFNLNKDKHIGMGLLEVTPSSIMFEKYCRVVASGEPLEESFVYSNETMPELNAEYDLRAIKFKDGVAVSSRNVSEKKKIEAEMARLDRLNLIGEMAASIAHEVRNPMTTVRGYLQHFQRMNETASYREQFHTMIDEIDRANRIISEFLSLAKNKAVELKPYNLNDIISALSPLIQAEAFRTGHDIQVSMGDVPDIILDDKEIRQLLLNLSQNSFEAMEAGGILTIETYTENDKVVLAIRDTGTGIPKEVLDKLGTPFLTTKDNGTGLGIPVCYRIADRHGAKIDVKTSLEGTTFIIAFKQHTISDQTDIPL